MLLAELATGFALGRMRGSPHRTPEDGAPDPLPGGAHLLAPGWTEHRPPGSCQSQAPQACTGGGASSAGSGLFRKAATTSEMTNANMNPPTSAVIAWIPGVCMNR
jgi:hypothetical protein